MRDIPSWGLTAAILQPSAAFWYRGASSRSDPVEPGCHRCALRVAIATMGGLVRGEQALPKAAEFLQRLIETDFLVLMNN